jgi:hypothetical protein
MIVSPGMAGFLRRCDLRAIRAGRGWLHLVLTIAVHGSSARNGGARHPPPAHRAMNLSAARAFARRIRYSLFPRIFSVPCSFDELRAYMEPREEAFRARKAARMAGGDDDLT